MGFHVRRRLAGDLELGVGDATPDDIVRGTPSPRRLFLVRRGGRVAGVLSTIALVGSLAMHPLQHVGLRSIALPDGSALLGTTTSGSVVTSMTFSSTSKVGIAPTPDGGGYWLVQPDGGVVTFGDALFYGSEAGVSLNKPMVGIARTADGLGYWSVAGDGGVFPHGDAQGFANCSLANTTLNAPVVGVAAMPTVGNEQGFWMVAGDGGLFPCGTGLQNSYGNPVGHTTSTIVGMAASPDGHGYWMVGSDAHVYPFGDAYNCSCSVSSSAPVVGIVPTPFNRGYWLVASDGGVFSVGDAAGGFYGSLGGQGFTTITAMAPTYDARGYWLVFANGTVVPFGDAGLWS